MNPIRQKRAYGRPRVRSRAGRALDAARAGRLVELARVHLQSQRPEEAGEVLRSALVLDPTDPQIRLELARALYHAGAFEEAIRWLGPLAGIEARLLLGRIRADQRDYPAALAAFSAVLECKPDHLEARLRRAAVLLATGQPGAALPDLDRALALRPDSDWARSLRASARIDSAQPAAALDDLAAVDAERQTAYQVLLEARARSLAEQPEPIVDQTYRRGIARHPLDPRLRLAFARHLAARRARDPQAAESARAELEALIQAGRAGGVGAIMAEALFLLAELSAEGPGDLERAEALYHQGLGLAPDDPAGLCGLAQLLLDQRRPAHALPWLVRAALVDPEYPRTLELLARALPVLADDEARARWLGLLISGLPQQSPTLLARLLRPIEQLGRADAHQDMLRQAHRMKNRVAVVASRARQTAAGADLTEALEGLYTEWSRFLQTLRLRPPAARLLSLPALLRRAIKQTVAAPDRLTSTLPPDLPPVLGDEEQLVDALANLLTNALQASPPHAAVRVALRAADDGRWVEAAVTDRGPGIDPRDRARIFEAGYTTRPDGTGVGLAIAQRAAAAHGGRLSVASAAGGPTTFCLRLPAAASQLPAAPQPFETLALERLAATEVESG